MNDRLSAGCRISVVLLVLAMLSAAGPYAARAAEEEEKEIDIAGQYSCRGNNPDGWAYTGKVAITKTGQTYKVQWTIGATQAYVGVGIREGNVLSVCFASAGGIGVLAYKIQEDKDGPRLVGRWAALGGQKTQSETLTKGAPEPIRNPRRSQQITKVRPQARAKAS